METNWYDELPVAVTVCDTEGKIVYMNKKSAATFEKYGAEGLIGTNVLNCHPEPAKTMLANMLINENTNAYTIEKNGIKKMIYQTPWYENGEYKGYVEMSLVIPMEMKHFKRNP
ncbi:MAG: PAS domain-containing protein [Bacteroidales bacterium]